MSYMFEDELWPDSSLKGAVRNVKHAIEIVFDRV